MITVKLAKGKETEFTLTLPFNSNREMHKARAEYKSRYFPERNRNASCYEFYLQYCENKTLDDIKPYKGMNLKKFTDKYGKEEGTKRFEEWKKNGAKSRTLYGYIAKFGEYEGKLRYLEKNKHLSVSIDALKRTGKNDQEIAEIREKHSKSSLNTLDNFIKRHGKEKGQKLFNEYIKRTHELNKRRWPSQIQYWLDKGFDEQDSKLLVKSHQSKTIDTFIRIYGKDVGIEKYNEYNKKKSHSATLQGYIDRFGEETGKKLYYKKCKHISYTQSLKYYIDKYGDTIGPSMFIEYNKKKLVRLGTASKESLKLFIPLYKFCRKNGIERKDIFLGVNGSKEFYLNDNGFKLYDFTIRSKKNNIRISR